MRATVSAWWRRGSVIAASMALFPAVTVEAVTLRTNTQYVSFPSANMTVRAAGMSTGGGADMALDKAGNPHIVTAAGNSGSTGFLLHRRWTRSSDDWSGPALALEGTAVEDDNFYPVITVDDEDRVHVVYLHRNTTVTNVYHVHHAWCTNASGATPLSTNNWIKTPITTLTNAMTLGSLTSASNVLLYARGGVDATGDGHMDIRMDKAEWDGSAWTWSPVGVVASNRMTGLDYEGLHTPRLTYDPTCNILHLSYRDGSQNGVRTPAYTQSSQPTNPAFSNWAMPTIHGTIAVGTNEGTGGTGVLEDGRALALVWLGANRDGMGATANYTRTRAAGASGLWGPWRLAFTNDTRGLPANANPSTSYGLPVWACAPDGVGGLFAVYGMSCVSHWDPQSTNWSDVFTNLPAGPEGTPGGNLGVYSVDSYPKRSKVFHFRPATMSLYIGDYYAFRLPRGTMITVR